MYVYHLFGRVGGSGVRGKVGWRLCVCLCMGNRLVYGLTRCILHSRA